jgi:hypothetical protein
LDVPFQLSWWPPHLLAVSRSFRVLWSYLCEHPPVQQWPAVAPFAFGIVAVARVDWSGKDGGNASYAGEARLLGEGLGAGAGSVGGFRDWAGEHG